jgi:hypothetical protein
MPALIDPPEGWKYGFPKPAPVGADRVEFEKNETINKWLVENGYPQALIDMYHGHIRCRIIGEY